MKIICPVCRYECETEFGEEEWASCPNCDLPVKHFEGMRKRGETGGDKFHVSVTRECLTDILRRFSEIPPDYEMVGVEPVDNFRKEKEPFDIVFIFRRKEGM